MLPRQMGYTQARGCDRVARVRFVDRKALVRIGIALAVLAALGWLAGRFMCRCGSGLGKEDFLVKISSEQLRPHVQTLAVEIGERNVFRDGTLARAADYIEGVWRQQGYEVTRSSYEANHVTCQNLEVTRRGKVKPAEIVLVGAHYDSVEGSPGANDNGSAVASLLELSRYFAAMEAQQTVRFVAFVNEEPPFFETDLQGSRVYAKMARQRGDDIRAMMALETMGYYSNARGSQKFPSALFRLFYPSRANFVGFVSNLKSRSLMHRAVAAFREHSDFPVECCAMFENVAGIGWSDHTAFWKEGYPAFMVTDTAPFRYPYYHTAQDTPDKIDYDSLARVTEGLCGMVAALAAN